MKTLQTKVETLTKKAKERALHSLAVAGAITVFGAIGFWGSALYAQSDWDILAGIINLNKHNSKLTYEQREALRAIEDFARTQGEREFQREITREGAKQTLTINYGSGKQAQLVKDEQGNHYLLVDGTIYRYNQDFEGQARNNAQEQKVRFFACNYWKDFDKNGYSDYPEEYVGIKNKFRDNEKIILVSHDERNLKGCKWSMEIYAPNGKTIHKAERILTYSVGECARTGADFDMTGWLIQEGGYGNFKAVWYIDGNYDGSTEFEIVPTK